MHLNVVGLVVVGGGLFVFFFLLSSNGNAFTTQRLVRIPTITTTTTTAAKKRNQLWMLKQDSTTAATAAAASSSSDDAIAETLMHRLDAKNHNNAATAVEPVMASTATITTTNDVAQRPTEKEEEDDDDDSDILSLIHQLETTANTDDNDEDPNRFNRLLGSYEVAYTKSLKPNENPVGGKWTRRRSKSRKRSVFGWFPTLIQNIFHIRRRKSFQHVLPVNTTGLGQTIIQISAATTKSQAKLSNNNNNMNNNETALMVGNDNIRVVAAEAVNVISFEAFHGRFYLTVILRGDCTPLSKSERIDTNVVIQPLTNRAVQIFFDPPRIYVTMKNKRRNNNNTNRLVLLLSLQLGPKSNVLLDTPFVNDKVRLGLGGRSGSRFIFVKYPSEQHDYDAEVNEFRQFLLRHSTSQQPWKRPQLAWTMSLLSFATLFSLVQVPEMAILSKGFRWGLTAMFAMMAAAVTVTRGGIERDDNETRP